MQNRQSTTGENIFHLLNDQLQEWDVPWSNCLALGSDNAPVMTGERKGVYRFMKQQQPSLYLSGCPCHLLHHAIEKAVACLPFSIEQVLVDTYYYLDKSSKRLSALEKFQKLYEVQHFKILKHVPTCWLRIGPCVDRILENWDALKVFFVEEKATLLTEKEKKQTTTQAKVKKQTGMSKSKTQAEAKNQTKIQVEEKKQTKTQASAAGDKVTVTENKEHGSSYKETKVSSLEQFYRSPTNRLYCLFLLSSFKPFEKLLTTLQAEKPQIHTLRRSLHKLMRGILVKFVVPSAMYGKSVTEVPYDKAILQKKPEHILIGEKPAEFIKNKEQNHLRDSRIEEFYETVPKFYSAACDYMKKLPWKDDVLKWQIQN